MKTRLFLTTGLVAVGILVGDGAALKPLADINTVHTEQLADYGSNETAEIAGEHARDAGVRHDTDVQHHRN